MDWNPYNLVWLIPLGVWVVYELFSFVTRIPGYPGKRLPTLSQLVWWAYDKFVWLPYAVLGIFSWLFYHFFIERKRKPPNGSGS